MIATFSKLVIGTGLAATLALGAPQKPAEASTQDTINTAIGAAAVIGGIILYNNYQHKRQAANRVVGYTRNGGTVYGDGRIVMQNGQTVYPNSNGQYPWGQYTYYNPNAGGYTYGNPTAYDNGYYRNGQGRNRRDRDELNRNPNGKWNNGNHYGERKHGHGDHGDHDDGD